jgi:hypothetical protein
MEGLVMKVLLFVIAAGLIGYGLSSRAKTRPDPNLGGLVDQPDAVARTDGNLAIGVGAAMLLGLILF